MNMQTNEAINHRLSKLHITPYSTSNGQGNLYIKFYYILE